MLVHSLKLSRHLKMRNKVVYSTQIFCSHHWRKLEKLMIHTLARDSHSAATCITHTFLQRKGGRGENSHNSPADLIKLQNKSCSSRSPIYSTTHPCPAPLLYIMRHSTIRETVTCLTGFHHRSAALTQLANTGGRLVTECKQWKLLQSRIFLFTKSLIC